MEQEKRKAAINLNKSLKQNALGALFKALKNSGKCASLWHLLFQVVAYQNSGISYRKGVEFSMEKILQLTVVNIPSELYVTLWVFALLGLFGSLDRSTTHQVNCTGRSFLEIRQL